jgi:hypothetical protein
MTRLAISASLPMIGRIATARERRAAREFVEFAVRFLPVSPAVPRDLLTRSAVTRSSKMIT